jgi:hypothetical protein
MKRLVVVLAVLALPASAHAKELTALDVCGATACTRIVEHGALDAFMRSDDSKVEAPATPQPSYLLRVRVRDDTGRAVLGWTSRWLPAAGVLAYEEPAGRFSFTTPDPTLVHALERATRGRAARLARVYAPKTEPVARVAEVVPAPSSGGGGGFPALAWVGAAAGLLLVTGGAIRARTR